MGLKSPATGMELARASVGGPSPIGPGTGVSPRERCERAGLDIRHVEHPTSAGEIDGRANTLYIVEQPLGGPLHLGGVNDTAIIFVGDGKLVIPAGSRDYQVRVGGGRGLLLDITIDQTAPGAWGRIHAKMADRGVFDIEKIGSGKHPDATGTWYPGDAAGTGLFPSVTDPDGEVAVRIHDEHNGVMGDHHMRHPRPIGIWLGGGHRGTLRIEDSHIEGYPNNGLYASAIAGEVHCENTTFAHNGVSNGRIARGSFVDCVARFDADETDMENAHSDTHATQGFAAEAKKAGRGGVVDITDCAVEMGRVGRCGGGIDCRAGHGYGRIGVIKNTEISISDEAQWGGQAPCDIILGGGCESIVGCTLSGTADDGVSVWNRNDSPVELSNTRIDYPDSRRRVEGPIR